MHGIDHRLWQLRTLYGVSIERAARFAGIDPELWEQWERPQKKATPPVDSVGKIAVAFKVNPVWLVRGVPLRGMADIAPTEPNPEALAAVHAPDDEASDTPPTA
jgi:transcriptional regulator with XRE-family HTH domain